MRLLFWDIDTERFDPKSYPEYTIGRVLEAGDRQAVAWLQGLFSEHDIRRVIVAERRLSRRSATFWALVYRVPVDQVSALKQTN